MVRDQSKIQNPKYQVAETKSHHERTFSQFSYDPVRLNGKMHSGEKSLTIKETNSIVKNISKESEKTHKVEDFKV